MAEIDSTHLIRAESIEHAVRILSAPENKLDLSSLGILSHSTKLCDRTELFNLFVPLLTES